jgi:hypothetical protein
LGVGKAAVAVIDGFSNWSGQDAWARRTIDYVATDQNDPPLLLGALLAEGRIHLTLFDTGRRVTALIEILLR